MSMRALVLVVLTFALSLPLHAGDLLEPADYMKIMNDSKITYMINDKPAKNPIEEPKCPRRDERTRVVKKGSQLELVAWDVKPAAVKLLGEGESLFQEKKFDEAAAKYKAALAHIQ